MSLNNTLSSPVALEQLSIRLAQVSNTRCCFENTSARVAMTFSHLQPFEVTIFHEHQESWSSFHSPRAPRPCKCIGCTAAGRLRLLGSTGRAGSTSPGLLMNCSLSRWLVREAWKDMLPSYFLAYTRGSKSPLDGKNCSLEFII